MNRLKIPKRIIIHHSATADSETLSWAAIRRFHLNNGWSDIGYHAGAEMVNDGVECLYGRPDGLMGAHCRGQNDESLGFCFVGNYDLIEPSEALLEAACRRVLVPWLLTYKLTPAALEPHSDHSKKTCPGKMFDMDRLRRIAAGILEGSK